MKIYIVFCIFISTAVHGRSWSEAYRYSAAVDNVAQEQLNPAQDMLKQIAMQSLAPDVSYDLGVISYKKKEYDAAAAYFLQAAQMKNSPVRLQEQAWFNAGNSYAQIASYDAALSAYIECLRINPNNKEAQHNKEIIERMKNQQEQQQDQNNNKNEDKKSDKQEQSSQSNNERNTSDQDQNGTERDQQDGTGDSDRNGEHRDQKPQNKNEQGTKNNNHNNDSSSQNNKDHSPSEQNGQQENNQPQQSSPSADGAESQSQSNDQSEQQKSDTVGDRLSQQPAQDCQENEHHTKKDNQNSKQQPSSSQEQQKKAVEAQKDGSPTSAHELLEQAGPLGENPLEGVDQWVIGLLDEQEHADKNAQKKLLHAAAHGVGAGNVQNNW